MRVLLLVLLLLPQLAAARVFMCVDPATGAKSFSDRGCPTVKLQEEVRVQATNVDSGRRTARAAPRKTWTSDRDTRKTGLDFSAEQRRLNERQAPAIAGTETGNDESS